MYLTTVEDRHVTLGMHLLKPSDQEPKVPWNSLIKNPLKLSKLFLTQFHFRG